MENKILGINEVKIGDTLYYNKYGHLGGKWGNQLITGETTQSWICEGYSRKQTKINKKTLVEKDGLGRGYGDLQYYASKQQVDEITWLSENRSKIIQKLQNCFEYDVFKKVHAFLERGGK